MSFTPAATADADDTAATFGDRIRAARSRLGLSVVDLARAMAVKQKTIEAWEMDRVVPRANKLQMLAGVLNVSVGWLLTGAGDGVEPVEESPVQEAEVAGELARLKVQAMDLSQAISRLEKSIRTRA